MAMKTQVKSPQRESLTLTRQRKTELIKIVNMTVLGAFAAYNFHSFMNTGSRFELTVGILFSSWSAFIMWHYFTRRVVFEELDTGFRVPGLLRSKTIKWSQLVAIDDIDASPLSFILAWKPSPEEIDRVVVLSKRSIGEEGVGKIVALVKERCGPLPVFQRGTKRDALPS